MSETVRHLDTVSFNSTINDYARYITEFEGIVSEVSRITDRMINNWEGKGKEAFEKDSKQVRLNLKDVSDIMYDLRDALANAHAEYMKADDSLSKSFES